MNRVGGLLLTAYLMAPAFVVAAPDDPNTVTGPISGDQMERLERLVLDRLGPSAVAGSGVCAVAYMPGPGGSFNIQVGLTNYGPQQIEFVIINPFAALGGRALLIQSVFSTVSPKGGTVKILYPGTMPAGPAALRFTGLGTGGRAQFNLDPDTYANPLFGTTVRQMEGTEIEVVYSRDLRCVGNLKFDAALNASFALLHRSSP